MLTGLLFGQDGLILKSGEVLCTFYPDVAETVEFSMNDVKNGYRNATQQATSELIKQLIAGLANC